MKLFRKLTLVLLAGLAFLSCQKEYSEENGSGGAATGTLKADGSGECLPSSVQGIFIAGTTLTATNFIDVDVDFTAIGSYLISTDVVNGYSFSGVGIVTTAGIQTIRLKASGTPTAAGANTFTVTFGTSQCNIVVDVLPAGTGAATLTLAGAPGNCSGATVDGIYRVGTPTDASNSVTISVNATTVGTYNITVPASNGIIFTGAGALTTTGAHTIILSANGTPTAAGTNNSTITVGTSICTFPVTAVAGGGGGTPVAVYTLGGAPTACTGAVLAGTYQQSVAMTSANKVTLNVNVTVAGTYTISTTAVNGVTFTGTGTFAGTGAQTAVLTASGLPAAQGAFNFPATGAGGTSCPFSVTFTAAPAPANYTLGDCSAAVPAGTYAIGTALGASNTVTISANVVTAGVYSASTNTVNGMSFSVSNAVFSGTGAQTITLVGTGTPIAAGDFDFDVTAGSSTCTFTVTVVAAPSIYTWSFKVGSTTYSGDCEEGEMVTTPINAFAVNGTNAANDGFSIGIANLSGAITNGTYPGAPTTLPTGKFTLVFFYESAAGPTTYDYAPLQGVNITTSNVTVNTGTHVVQGTFSGTAVDENGATVNITQGTFKAHYP